MNRSTSVWSFTLEGHSHSNKPALQRVCHACKYTVESGLRWAFKISRIGMNRTKMREQVLWRVAVFLELSLPFYLEHIIFKVPFHFKDN